MPHELQVVGKAARTADERSRHSLCSVPPIGVRPPKPTPIVIAAYFGYVIVGWFLNGLGSVLPELEN